MDAINLFQTAFGNMMLTYPYKNLPDGVRFKLKENFYIEKGNNLIYANPRNVCTQFDSMFPLVMDYHIGLIEGTIRFFTYEKLIKHLVEIK